MSRIRLLAVILTISFFIPAVSVTTPAVAASSSAVTADHADKPATVNQGGAVSTGLSPSLSTQSADGRVPVVIFFESADARSNATFTASNITVTGGQNVEFTPVLFADVPQESIPRLESRSDVDNVVRDESVEIDYNISSTTTSQEYSVAAEQTTPWGVRRINARDASGEISDNSERGVTVAVLDSGIDYTHPNLDDNVVWGANFSNGVSERGLTTAGDNNGHGTAAAGIVAAEDDGTGVVGVAPHSRIYSIKVLNQDGLGRVSWIIQGMQASLEGPDGEIGTEDDADILSLSVGTNSDSDSLRTAVEEANDHAIVVASAGNDGDGDPSTNEIAYPANYSEVIAVAATDRNDETSGFSAEGDQIELAAPGVFVETTAPGGGTTSFTGTSAAAPHVSGAVALVLASDLADGSRDLSQAEIRQRLRDTATDIEADGVDRRAGYGLVQVDSALVTEIFNGQVAGTVTDESGAELSGATVTLLVGDSGTQFGTDTTDSDGVYQFSNLETGRNYTIEATYDGVTRNRTIRNLGSGTTNADISVPVSQSDGNTRPAVNVSVVAPATAERGEEIDVQYRVSNAGNGTATEGSVALGQPADTRIVGDQTTTLPASLSPDEQWNVTYRLVIEDSLRRDHVNLSSTIRLGDDEVSRLTTIQILRTNVTMSANDSVTTAPGQNVNVTYNIQNTGTTSPSAGTLRITNLSSPLTVRENETVLPSERIPAPGETTRHSVQVLVPDTTAPGTYQLTGAGTLRTAHSNVTAISNTTITVEAVDDRWSSEYVGSDDVVRADGLNTAIGDYLRGDVTDSQLNSVIRSYLSTSPLQ